jgi:hypothetical protein
VAEALGRFGRQRLRSLPSDPTGFFGERAQRRSRGGTRRSTDYVRRPVNAQQTRVRERPERRTGSRRGPKLDGVGPRAIFGAISKDPDSCPRRTRDCTARPRGRLLQLACCRGQAFAPGAPLGDYYSIPTARDSKAPRHRRFDARLSALHHRDHRTIPLGQSFVTVLDVLKLAGRSPWTHPGLRQHWLERGGLR